MYLINGLNILLQAGFVLALSPILEDLLQKMKASFQGTPSPPLFKSYRELFHLLSQSVEPLHTNSQIRQFTPLVLFSTALYSSLMVPTFLSKAPISHLGGLLFLVALLILNRFFLVSSLAQQTQIQSFLLKPSPEVFLLRITEFIFLATLLNLALFSGTMDLNGIVSWHQAHSEFLIQPLNLLAILALLITTIAEMDRIPIGLSESTSQRQAPHEYLQEMYTGPQLGIIYWSHWIKNLMLLSLLVSFVLPWGISNQHDSLSLFLSFLIYFGKLLMMCLLIESLEILIRKFKLFRFTKILSSALLMTLCCIVTYLQSHPPLPMKVFLP
ncbi:hypothetical protein COW36_15185 [bacterium (Candidatus Blackallbacteria) CG17_big_fil_post_rev_8_21_14_2_50_48_46]|uniref:Formate hydrogenlyase n=1 Tax=bacterium (Candidatus Blackallbacteria) CG17_big_fil_post_rev_8_21_14_2_50_48_46 TaxID=2014261 RepID=A0A2M7G2N3_9BACT|nr:MAG: hypothetical protein COW64_11365 [bacterium (Candidatus Blackallbacteria) CG18_big_fil_WC_8_21_14_2_50_49_26]PIW16054.1 MAG: hypothetical protein COW36_15185 [bacterium (Candidatus Blackallbacteria) CG17_big_fil_post_rev_8_21_14_2_50_48_46]PIW50466.1 MAG: hypothetical protein COW20_02900 [bacterium (Candidatus Blackallbacteria) CG13_big_fil_rev_8_21_14_2_50_49_14]